MQKEPGVGGHGLDEPESEEGKGMSVVTDLFQTDCFFHSSWYFNMMIS